MIFHTLRQRQTAIRFIPIYLANLFITFHWALFLYIDSSFLEKFFSKTEVGVLYIAGAAFSLFLLLKTRLILRHIRTFQLLVITTILEFVAIGLLVFSLNPVIIAFAFILHFGAIFEIILSLDLFLEALTKDSWTGTVRSEYLTLMSAVIMISPLVAGELVALGGYSYVYAFALLALIPFFLLVVLSFNRAQARVTHHHHLPTNTFVAFTEKPALRNIYLARLTLSFFFSWMIIYTPIYLHTYAGRDWGEIGIIFTIMLLPFVLFQIPAGKLADDRLGEKEMLILGFIIMGVFTFVIPFIPLDAGIALWAGILFMTRVGASLVETMTESYFFKHVDATNENLIGFFRTTDPLSYIIGPLLATIAFIFIPSFETIFYILGGICFLGLWSSIPLKDTK